MVTVAAVTSDENGEGQADESLSTTTDAPKLNDTKDSDANNTDTLTMVFLIIGLVFILLMVCAVLFYVTKRRTVLEIVPSKSIDAIEINKKREQQPSDTIVDTDLENMEQSIDGIANNGLPCDEFIVEDEEDRHMTIGSNVAPKQSLDSDVAAVFTVTIGNNNDDEIIIDAIDATHEGDQETKDTLH